MTARILAVCTARTRSGPLKTKVLAMEPMQPNNFDSDR